MTTVGASPQLKRWKRTHREESSTRARGFRSRRGASPRARARRRPPWRSRRVELSSRGDATVSPGPSPSACVPPHVSTRLARKRVPRGKKSRLEIFFPRKLDLPGAKTSRVFSAIRTCAPTPRPARSKPPASRRALFSSDALVTVHRRTPRLTRGRPQRRRVRGSSKRRPKKRVLRRTRRAPPRVPSTSSPPHIMLRVLRACASGIRVQEARRQARHPLSRRARRPPGPARWPLRDILCSVLRRRVSFRGVRLDASNREPKVEFSLEIPR